MFIKNGIRYKLYTGDFSKMKYLEINVPIKSWFLNNLNIYFDFDKKFTYF